MSDPAIEAAQREAIAYVAANDGIDENNRQSRAEFIAGTPELVRELITKNDELTESRDGWKQLAEDAVMNAAKARQERDELRAKVDAVRALCDDKSVGPLYEHVIRRALDGDS